MWSMRMLLPAGAARFPQWVALDALNLWHFYAEMTSCKIDSWRSHGDRKSLRTWHHSLETAEVDDSLHKHTAGIRQQQTRHMALWCSLHSGPNRKCLHKLQPCALSGRKAPSQYTYLDAPKQTDTSRQPKAAVQRRDLRPCPGGQRPRPSIPPPCPECTSCLHMQHNLAQPRGLDTWHTFSSCNILQAAAVHSCRML